MSQILSGARNGGSHQKKTSPFEPMLLGESVLVRAQSKKIDVGIQSLIGVHFEWVPTSFVYMNEYEYVTTPNPNSGSLLSSTNTLQRRQSRESVCPAQHALMDSGLEDSSDGSWSDLAASSSEPPSPAAAAAVAGGGGNVGHMREEGTAVAAPLAAATAAADVASGRARGQANGEAKGDEPDGTADDAETGTAAAAAAPEVPAEWIAVPAYPTSEPDNLVVTSAQTAAPSAPPPDQTDRDSAAPVPTTTAANNSPAPPSEIPRSVLLLATAVNAALNLGTLAALWSVQRSRHRSDRDEARRKDRFIAMLQRRKKQGAAFGFRSGSGRLGSSYFYVEKLRDDDNGNPGDEGDDEAVHGLREEIKRLLLGHRSRL